MPKNNNEVERRHGRRGVGVVFAGLLIVVLGLMSLYQFSWPFTLITMGLLLMLFGLTRMSR